MSGCVTLRLNNLIIRPPLKCNQNHHHCEPRPDEADVGALHSPPSYRAMLPTLARLQVIQANAFVLQSSDRNLLFEIRALILRGMDFLDTLGAKVCIVHQYFHGERLP